MNIFVGNLSFDAVEADIKKLFEGFGNVASVVIVRRKEKKTPKSRGFGFVEMPDEQQALAAIAALNGKEFMERVLNIDPVRPKTEAQRESELRQKRQLKVRAQAKGYLREDGKQKEALVVPVFNKPGAYKGGRRTHSYMKRHGLTEMPSEAPRRRNKYNPMRWRKRRDQPKPWSKSSERPQEARFNPSTSLGMVRGNGERSRTKGRKKQGGYKRLI